MGERIKALRIAASASGVQLAQKCSISRSMLSRIERGTVSASVEMLDRIARGLDVPLSRFFADQADRIDFSFVPAGKGIVVDRISAVAGYRYELLGHLLSGNLFVEPYLVRLLPGAKPYTSFQHPGVKFVHLMSGQVRYRYGSRALEMQAGDSLLLEANALHGVEAIGQEPVCYLAVVFTIRN
ncbi:helix-turn-helix domain-containing protein [Variovorax sp. WS11]|uniref:helix-turn-helix domain-containing protein n=1 Tax=Variovorax sp. WS11 TaxID=1105204 RepID=UPI0021597808|nr:XRE family transcriptional regulator [Variovorax sp. WS11]